MLTETFENKIEFDLKLAEYTNDNTKKIWYCGDNKNNELHPDSWIIQWTPSSIIIPEFDKDFLPGTFGCHEAFDRAAMLRDMVGKLSDHTAVKQNKIWSSLADDAYKALSALYQAIGQEHDK
jgi:hypothetical protein